MPPPRRIAATLKFPERLVLFQWLLGQFGAASFDALAKDLRDNPALEEFDGDGATQFVHILRTKIGGNPALPADRLLAYDENIGRHWRRITERRGQAGLRPKYFQYLMLLFTELYLDRYFGDRDGLLASLNAHVRGFNAGKGEADQVGEYTKETLNKLAFWSATGSGKTLLMHVNLLQYRHYLKQAGREGDLSQTLLLTPGEDLSRQHITEYGLSGLDAASFSKTQRSMADIEVLEFSKLADTMGEKTVAVDAFGGTNLVFVDEGHRGAGGEEWKPKRDKLCAQGFSFEYSATFGQAMTAAAKPELTREYARCLAFDYSYGRFHEDGYGKEYRILNLPDTTAGNKELYLTGCLLAFYQQQRVFREGGAAFAPFLFARPLWVCVGSSVSAVRTENGREVSDVVDVLRFLADFLQNPGAAQERLHRLLHAQHPLLDGDGNDVFFNVFSALVARNLPANALYADILQTLFHAPASGKLHVDNLKGADGEIALRVGDNPPFGVINVGDTNKLLALCRRQDDVLAVGEREFGGSLFDGINDAGSSVNVLIGSKKFSAGWSSWRVSTMGLLNIGRSEGSEIIQLFGRGVRLRGYGFGLQRSEKITAVPLPPHIDVVETLNVFGVRADYMRTFQEDLEREGAPVKPQHTLTLPILRTPEDIAALGLKTLKLKDGVDFEQDGTPPVLSRPPTGFPTTPITLDWYVKLDLLAAKGLASGAALAVRETAALEARHLAFFDWERVYEEVAGRKAEKHYDALSISCDSLRELMAHPDWYALTIPKEELDWTAFAKVREWEDIAIALLRKYVDRFYKHTKAEYEMPQLEYRTLDSADDNFPAAYRVSVETGQASLEAVLRTLQAELEVGTLGQLDRGNLQAFGFERHLYHPLMFCANKQVKVSPVPLNEGERDFVRDLRVFFKNNPSFLESKTLYLLRNQSRGKGIGFFEAGNFYPDFLLWLVDGPRQYVTFVDPKGIRNLDGLHDPKIAFAQTIKQLQARLADPNVILNSFIVSNTDRAQIAWLTDGLSKADLEARHVLFQNEDKATYISTLLASILASG